MVYWFKLSTICTVTVGYYFIQSMFDTGAMINAIFQISHQWVEKRIPVHKNVSYIAIEL